MAAVPISAFVLYTSGQEGATSARFFVLQRRRMGIDEAPAASKNAFQLAG